MSHICDKTCLPDCKYATRGAGIGLVKLNPSTPGRDKREKAYMADHDYCECAGCEFCLWPAFAGGCQRASTDCDHIGGRGLGGVRRQTARLRAMCHECHMADPHGRRVSTPNSRAKAPRKEEETPEIFDASAWTEHGREPR